MKKIIFVCHGNICRSPAAEYIAKEIDKEHKYQYISRAVSAEETGNDIYPPMKKVLIKYKIPYSEHHAKKITLEEYKEADIIFCMDQSNITRLNMLFPYENHSKVRLLQQMEIEDPWYTGDFETVFLQIKHAIIRFLSEENI